MLGAWGAAALTVVFGIRREMVIKVQGLPVAVLLAGTAILLALPPRPGTPARADQGSAGPEKKLYFGPAACVTCHDREPAYSYGANEKNPPFTACNEMQKREPADKHAIAYQV